MAQRYAVAKEVNGPKGTGVAPEFGEVNVEPWLTIAQGCIGLERWGENASWGHALLTAHMLEVHVGPDGEGGLETGPLTSEAHGPASRGFAAPGLTDAELQTTSYGRAFMLLRRKVSGRGRAVVMNSRVRQLQ